MKDFMKELVDYANEDILFSLIIGLGLFCLAVALTGLVHNIGGML